MAEENPTTPVSQDEEVTETATADAVTADAVTADAAAETDAPESAEDQSSDDNNENSPESSEDRVETVQPELNDALSSGSSVDENAPRKDVPNGRAYEIIFIARAVENETTEALTQRLRDLIENADGAVDNVRTSETRRLAYPIQKEVEGIYIVVNARFEKSLVTELDRFFKLDETVLRHMLIREDA